MNILTQEEMQRFLIQAKQDGYYELFLLELGTGLRLGEILALQWDDLNMETGELRITKSATFIKGELHITEPKTKSSVRVIVLPGSLLEILKIYKATVTSRWMFPSPVKEDCPLTPNFVRCRVCGRADNVLSQIILDSTVAAEQIPKDARGRFLLHDGTVFQGYLFDEESL